MIWPPWFRLLKHLPAAYVQRWVCHKVFSNTGKQAAIQQLNELEKLETEIRDGKSVKYMALLLSFVLLRISRRFSRVRECGRYSTICAR